MERVVFQPETQPKVLTGYLCGESALVPCKECAGILYPNEYDEPIFCICDCHRVKQ